MILGIIAATADAEPLAGRSATAWLTLACDRSARVSRTTTVTRENVAVELERLAADAPSTLVVVLDARFPLTTAADIDGAIARALDGDLDSVVATTTVSSPVWIDGERRASSVAVETEALRVVRAGTNGRVGRWELPADHAGTTSNLGDRARCEHLLRERERAARVERLPARVAALVFDFDGVFTDNQVIVDQNGIEAVSCSRSDAFGLAACRELGIPMIVLSTEANPVVAARCKKLGLAVVQGLADKGAQLDAWLAEMKLSAADTVYLGNDINDLGCFERVGCAAAPADVHSSMRSRAAIVLDARGGHGAVRELCELVCQRARQHTTP